MKGASASKIFPTSMARDNNMATTAVEASIAAHGPAIPVVTDDQKCHLMELPPEIRLFIYDQYFGKTEPYYATITYDGGRCRAYRRLRRPASPLPTGYDRSFDMNDALLKTCRLIRQEAEPVMFQKIKGVCCIHYEQCRQAHNSRSRKGTELRSWKDVFGSCPGEATIKATEIKDLKQWKDLTIVVGMQRSIGHLPEQLGRLLKGLDWCASFQQLTLMLLLPSDGVPSKSINAVMEVLKCINTNISIRIAVEGDKHMKWEHVADHKQGLYQRGLALAHDPNGYVSMAIIILPLTD